MTLYGLKPTFQKLLRPIMQKLNAKGVTANQVTLLAMLLSIFLGVALSFANHPIWLLFLPFFLFFRMALNAIDGMLARECNQQSQLGAILNEVGDVVSDAALYLPFALFLPTPWLTISVVFLAVLTEFCGVLTQTLVGQRSYAGPMGKSDRAFIFGAGALVLAIFPEWAVWGSYVMAILALLLIWTCINRCRAALISEAK